MQRFSRQITFSFFALLFLASGLFVPPVTRAAEPNGQGITVSPVLVELNAEPGKKYTIDITVTNVTAGDLILNSEANDFTAKDDTGTPDILLNEDNGTYSMRRWIESPERVRLKSKESRVVKAFVTVPANAEPGGHYGVIRFSGIAPELDGTGVALSASVGTLILTRVAGDIKESAIIEDFYFEQSGNESWWFEQTPVQAVERITNNGSVHVKPSGTLELKDIFGRSTAKLPVNQDGRNILPGSTRRFDQSLDTTWLLGPYKARLELAYGTQGQVLQSETTVWFIPWRLILALIIAVIAIFLALRWLLKKYNARIIKKAQSSSPPRKK